MARSMARQRGGGGEGGAQRLLIGGGAIVVLVLTFALGVVVGRTWSPHREPEPAAEAPRKPAVPVARRSGLTDPVPERPAQEKLTFYQTLTAPMSTPAVPTTVSASAKPEVAKPRPAAERASGDRPAAATPASA